MSKHITNCKKGHLTRIKRTTKDTTIWVRYGLKEVTDTALQYNLTEEDLPTKAGSFQKQKKKW